MVEFPEDDEAFAAVVDRAVKDRGTVAERMRDRLADPAVIGRTIAALRAVVAVIDAQLDSWPDGERVVSRERARDKYWQWLVWYETERRFQAADDGS